MNSEKNLRAERPSFCVSAAISLSLTRLGQLLVAANVKAYVYGTLDKPVNALNLERVYSFIRKKHFGSPVLAVDSCIGDEVGKISVSGAIRPASARGVDLGAVGDASIIAVTSPSMDKSVPLGSVYKLAVQISRMIYRYCGSALRA